jgi:hypothetical protein
LAEDEGTGLLFLVEGPHPHEHPDSVLLHLHSD